MDEIPVFLDLERFQKQKVSAFRLTGSAGERPLFSVVMAALSDGSLLPPLLLFTGTSCPVPDGFPDNVLLEARPRGFTDRDIQDVWIDKVGVAAWLGHTSSHVLTPRPPVQVWRPHAAPGPSLLIADVHRGHLSEDFRRRLGSLDTALVFVPSGCSRCVQPLDVCVTPVLQDFLQVGPAPSPLTCPSPSHLCSPADSLEPPGLPGRPGRAGSGPPGPDPGLLAQRGLLHPQLGDPLPAQVSGAAFCPRPL